VDSDLSSQFSNSNIDRMLDGFSPHPRVVDQVGGRKIFELHHEKEISRGGAVYSVDNLSVLTPKRHIEVHKGER
jgi:hypothetical protein